jgi:hypothetical protein
MIPVDKKISSGILALINKLVGTCGGVTQCIAAFFQIDFVAVCHHWLLIDRFEYTFEHFAHRQFHPFELPIQR